jgi:hypothetical protein
MKHITSLGLKMYGLIWLEKPEETRSIKRSTRVPTFVADQYSHIDPLRAGQMEMPTSEAIKNMQALYNRTGVPDLILCAITGLWMLGGLVWIPSQDVEMTTRIMIVGHYGIAGHRGSKALSALLKEKFWIHKLQEKCDEFCASCLICLQTKGGTIIQRPWAGERGHPKRNEYLHWDYVFIGDSNIGHKWILVMKDAASHFVVLRSCVEPTMEHAALCILEWNSMFGMPKVWVSDKGTHFVNGVIAELARLTGSNCEYILAYCHWKNGSVERVNRDLLQVFKAMIAETKLEMERWTEIVLTVMCVLNHTISQALAGKTAIECFTALKHASVVDRLFLLEELAKPTMHELRSCAE